jgi:hypothetical protein
LSILKDNNKKGNKETIFFFRLISAIELGKIRILRKVNELIILHINDKYIQEFVN